MNVFCVGDHRAICGRSEGGDLQRKKKKEKDI
jgi:hypothetical protein